MESLQLTTDWQWCICLLFACFRNVYGVRIRVAPDRGRRVEENSNRYNAVPATSRYYLKIDIFDILNLGLNRILPAAYQLSCHWKSVWLRQ